jgi:microcystin degradation protein MlrC
VAHAWSQAEADRVADHLCERIAASEAQFASRLWPVAEGVAEASRLARAADRPVIIADTQDNPGAGGSGRTTGILAELVRSGATGAVVGLLCDEAAAGAAHAAGEGAELVLSLGGDDGPLADPPFTARFRVERTGSGRFMTSGKICGVMPADLGAMALLRCEGVQVIVTSQRMQTYDPAPFHHLGVDPAAQRILVLKSSCHFRADFEPMAAAVLTVIAPGGYLADATRYPYRRLRSGLRLSPLGPVRGHLPESDESHRRML